MWCTSNKISLEPPPTVSPEKLEEKDEEIKRLKRKVRRTLFIIITKRHETTNPTQIKDLEHAMSKQLQAFVPIDTNDGIRTPTSRELEHRLPKIRQSNPSNSMRLPERSATGLVFDCGTNETKAILYTLKNGHIRIKIYISNLRLDENHFPKSWGIRSRVQHKVWHCIGEKIEQWNCTTLTS